MSEVKFYVDGAISFGWKLFKENWGFLIGVFIINLLIIIIPEFFIEAMLISNVGLFLIVNLLHLFVIYMVEIGYLKILITLARGEGDRLEVMELFRNYHLFFKYFVGILLYGLIVAIGVVTPIIISILFVSDLIFFFGVVLGVIIGIILAIKFFFVDYFIVDQELGPLEALERSAEVTEEIKGELFLFMIVILLINIVGALVLLLGLLVTVPVTGLAMAYVYCKLNEDYEDEELEERLLLEAGFDL
ncbi:hypothetical protein [Halonatronum saccharophilum]|uniref:hypothetical protein n=1 Tax=Halonatronum saccharophilum TaxID=150060 RepID=UPI000481EDFC|nr:hypothetical protein [Halonatronum saccharophilum]